MIGGVADGCRRLLGEERGGRDDLCTLAGCPLLILGLALLSAHTAVAQDNWVVKTSPKPVPDTVKALTAAVEGAGASVAAVVDHAAGAKKVGM